MYNAIAGIIDGEYKYLAVDSTEGDVFQIASMNSPELTELMNMYNRSCSHIDFSHLLGPLGMIYFLLFIFAPPKTICIRPILCLRVCVCVC